MNALVAALAAIPRIAAALETLATSLHAINARAIKAHAAKRREAKDEEVDARIAAVLVGLHPDEAEQRRATNESERLCCGCNCCAGVDSSGTPGGE